MRTKHKRLRFSKRWDDRGVASTVGTIMAIMVILALLSLVTNHYVPVWMKDNESNHMELALTQLGSFKTTMDNQMLFAEVLFYTGTEFTSTPVYTAVKLGSDGIPVFASPTQGELGLHTDEGALTVQTKYQINATIADYVDKSTMGNIKLVVPNRYFVPQTLVYENGGIIIYQGDGEAMVAEPRFSIANNSASGNYSYDVSMTLIWLFGVGSASGSGVEGISSKLIGMDFQKYENVNSSIYINLTTNYGPAWYDYYNKTLSEAYSPADVDYTETSSSKETETSFYVITLDKIGPMEYTLSIELKNTSDCLNNLRLNIAYMEIAIGRKRGGVEF